MYTYKEKKEIYDLVSHLIEEKTNDSFFRLGESRTLKERLSNGRYDL